MGEMKHTQEPLAGSDVADRVFQEYATSAAFSLSVSTPMVRMLLDMEAAGLVHGHSIGWGPRTPRDVAAPLLASMHGTATSRALMRRGLVRHTPHPDTIQLDTVLIWVWSLTPAGTALCPLLRLAGFSSSLPTQKAGE